MNLDDIDPVELGAALSKLPPHHPLVAAARAAVDVSDGRDQERRDQKEASNDMSVGWRRERERIDGDEKMWRARAEFDGRGRATDEAKAVVSRLDAPVPPLREPQPTAEQDAALKAAVDMARSWLADLEADERDMERRAREARWVADDQAEAAEDGEALSR